jgi:hypothetical protein
MEGEGGGAAAGVHGG